MNQKQIIHKLENRTLDSYERERLNQLLHYMRVEGVDTSIQGTHHGPRTTGTRTSQKNKHSKSKSRSQQHRG